MTGRRSSPSVLIQVGALAVLAVIASQIVTFVVIVTAPPPEPVGFSAADAADAALGKPAETSDGRALLRRLSDRPGVREISNDPIATLIATSMARRMDVPVGSVRVAVAREGLPGRRDDRWPRMEGGTERFVFRRSASAPEKADNPDGAGRAATQAAIAMNNAEAAARRADEALMTTRRTVTIRESKGAPAVPLPPTGIGNIQIITTGPNAQRFSVLADRLTFRPFSVSVQLPDGRWSTVNPPRGLIDPWQARILISLAISLLLLAPLVWLLARRLTRPIRVFAEAAQRLGDDPDAPPLKASGPVEVRTAIAAFNEMQAALRGHIRRRTQTVAAIAHDLRTPLTRLRFRAEQAPDALRDRMAADVEEMDALISQAMAYVRGETAPDRREPLDLADLARVCAEGFAETGAAVTFAADGPLPIKGDPAALRRAVGNLIDNAVKFAGSARVWATVEGDRATIVVADDGPGLDATELETVFEPFQRGERSRSRQTGGTGLGLAVARQAARAAGGDVILRNRPEGGLEAVLLLPRTSAA